MPTNREHKGTFYVKAKSRLHLPTDGAPYAVWSKLIPSNMIISKYWVTSNIRSQDNVSLEGTPELNPMDINLSGFLSNVVTTSSMLSNMSSGSDDHALEAGDIAIDTGDSLNSVLSQIGCMPSSALPQTDELAESGGDVGLPGGANWSKYWQDRQFFERKKTLRFPKDTILVSSDTYRFFDSFSTSGTKLGQNSTYKMPRVLSFFFTSDNQVVTFMKEKSEMLTGANSTDTDISISEWDRQAQTVFDPVLAYPSWYDSSWNPDAFTLSDLDTGTIGTDAARGGYSSNIGVPGADYDAADKFWSVDRWLRYGLHDSDPDLDQDLDIDFFIDLDVTLQCQMYIPGHRKIVTLP